MFQCNLCGSDIYVIVANKDQIRFQCYGHDKKIVRCWKCGLVQMYPMWTEQELDNLYSHYSLKKDFRGQKKYSKKVDYYVEEYFHKRDRILEIGAGGGENVLYFKRKGYKITGIDKDSSVCDGQLVHNYDFNTMSVNETFDFIYGIHVLEHVKEPKEFLNRMFRMTNEGGRFLFEIPNIDEPLLALYKNRAFRKFYWYPFHLYFYDRYSVCDLFSKVKGIDFQVTLKQRYGLMNHVRWILFNKPSSFNYTVPILDRLYKMLLTKVLKKTDTLVITGYRHD